MTTKNKIALVTGAGSGIGRAAALALQAAGYDVVLAGHRTSELEKTAAMADAGRGRTLVGGTALLPHGSRQTFTGFDQQRALTVHLMEQVCDPKI